jgi:hypothetical protein
MKAVTPVNIACVAALPTITRRPRPRQPGDAMGFPIFVRGERRVVREEECLP